MKTCKTCGKPLRKQSRTEHFRCRMIRRVFKKIQYGVDMNSQHFEQACKGLDENPKLLLKKF